MVYEGFHHVLLKHGHENAEMQKKKRKFDDVTLQYSIGFGPGIKNLSVLISERPTPADFNEVRRDLGQAIDSYSIHWVISSSRTVFMNKNSGRIRAFSWYLIIVYRSHNNKNDHLTRPQEGLNA